MKTPFEIFLVTGGFFVLVVRGWVRRFTAGTGFGIPPGCLCAFTFRVWFIGFQAQNAGGVGGFGREPVKIIRWDFFVGRRWWRLNGSEKHGTVVLMVRKNRIISSTIENSNRPARPSVGLATCPSKKICNSTGWQNYLRA